MELDEVLNEKPEQPAEPAPAQPTQEKLPLEQTAPAEQAVETVKSSRKQHQSKEQEAQDAGRKRNPDGTFAPAEPVVEAVKEAAPAAPPRQELTPKEKAFLADAQAERGKRQELERRLAALEQQRAQPAQPVEGQPATFWDNPEENLTKHQQSIRQELVQAKIQISEEFAKSRHPDYIEKIPVFGEMLRTTPGLYEQWIAAPNMAEFAYTLASNKMALQEAGDLPNYRKKIEEETRAAVRKEIEEETKAKEAERAKLAAALPRTLSDVRGVNQQTPVFGGPTPLDSVIGR